MIADQDEKLDLVDENDLVIGEVTRAEANSNPKFIHREVAVLIYDNDKRLLFTKRSAKKVRRPGFWDLGLGGHIGKGEDPLVAAHRELMEELGFDLELKFLRKTLDHEHNETRFMYEYWARWHGEEIKFDPDEIGQVEFLDQKALAQMMAAGAQVSNLSQKVAREFWAGKFRW